MYKIIAFLVIVVTLVVSFQNCSSSFQVSNSGDPGALNTADCSAQESGPKVAESGFIKASIRVNKASDCTFISEKIILKSPATENFSIDYSVYDVMDLDHSEPILFGSASFVVGAKESSVIRVDLSQFKNSKKIVILATGNSQIDKTSLLIDIHNSESNYKQIALGYQHTCAILSDDTVACWGENRWGQLGNGSTASSITPVPVSGISGVKSIALGMSDSCALLNDNTVACWGSKHALTPVTLNGLSGVKSIASGGAHSCAILSDDTVSCWGVNQYGQLGNGSTASSITPVPVSGLSGVKGIALGKLHSCALLNSGSVSCWGGNSWDGFDPKTILVTPAALPGLSDVKGIASDSSSYHTCAILNDDTVACWG